ncbi:hypothetical protein F753_21715 [Stutzerimonas chloritidismutans AW-1]|uniref:Uncharacterized protein n=1 Tax=Stutzerimonas chloritidismutans AW-1 TaxID=1263865 RepID=V4Q6E1_STUCH|nr:hypothetical protein F753_21715 [Stutzerimonas chloritidismutans AW-1]
MLAGLNASAKECLDFSENYHNNPAKLWIVGRDFQRRVHKHAPSSLAIV